MAIEKSIQLNPRALAKNQGKIALYESVEKMEYNYNLKAFFENVDTIYQAAAAFNKLCQMKNETEHIRCEYLSKNLEIDLQTVEINANLLKTEHRTKRNAGKVITQIAIITAEQIPTIMIGTTALMIINKE